MPQAPPAEIEEQSGIGHFVLLGMSARVGVFLWILVMVLGVGCPNMRFKQMRVAVAIEHIKTHQAHQQTCQGLSR